MRWSNRKTHSLVNNSQTASLRFRSVFDICSSSSGLPESPNTFNQWPSCREKYIDNYMCSWKISLVFYCLHVLVHQRRGTQPGKKFGGCVLGIGFWGFFIEFGRILCPFTLLSQERIHWGLNPRNPTTWQRPWTGVWGLLPLYLALFHRIIVSSIEWLWSFPHFLLSSTLTKTALKFKTNFMKTLKPLSCFFRHRRLYPCQQVKTSPSQNSYGRPSSAYSYN